MNKGLIVLAIAGAGVATYILLDQQNILPWANNPNKKWIWERLYPAQISASATIPAQFRQRPQNMALTGVVIAPSALTSVSTGNFLNGIEGAQIGAAPQQKMQTFYSGKYR